MDKREFRNGLCLLHSLDYHEVSHVISEEKWPSFRDKPVEFFLRADDPTASGIWEAMKKRMS